MPVHFDAGRFCARWQVPGLSRPLVSFAPEALPTGPDALIINPEAGDKHP